MNYHVIIQIVLLIESFSAILTAIRFLLCVNSQMLNVYVYVYP